MPFFNESRFDLELVTAYLHILQKSYLDFHKAFCSLPLSSRSLNDSVVASLQHNGDIHSMKSKV